MDTSGTKVEQYAVKTVPREYLEGVDVNNATVFVEEEIGMDSQTEESSEESEDDDEEELVENPSVNVKHDLQRILDGDLAFKGSFSFNKTYDNAPNPVLRIDGLGHIGLPLSSREAKEVITHSIQAPFGKGERTIVDTTVRDTWEIDASKVHFDNPAWASFLNGVVQEVCQTLGVNFSVSQPRCEPYKLLLYETGSHFLPHQDTEKTKGMFATVIVVLPSAFTGGCAHVSHGTLSKVLDCSADSLCKTSVLSWYTDVTHEIKPITSGYRLAIAYNLIHTTNSLKPMLSENGAVVNKLRHVLLSWKHEKSPMPLKLIYLLEHKYSHANLKGSALKGADAHRVAFLESVARPLGFHLGLANLECHLVGSGDDEGYRYSQRRGRHGYYDDSSDSVDEDNVGMADVEERTMTIENLVDLEDGYEIQDTVDYNEDDDEFIPADLQDRVESGPVDEQEYEGYQGNGAGSLEQWYRRTVLVIWPHSHNPDMEYGDDPSDAINFIVCADRKKSTKEDRHMIQFLLRGAAEKRFGVEALRGLCEAACVWRDLPLWKQAMDVCGGTDGVDRLSKTHILDAIDSFGFENIRPFVEKMLTVEPNNARRIELVNIIAGTEKDAVGTTWIAQQWVAVVQALKRPQIGEETLLVELAQKAGGVSFFQTTLLPQIIAIAEVDFLLSLATHLFKIKTDFGHTPEEITTVKTIVTELLTLAVAKADFFRPNPIIKAPAQSVYPLHAPSIPTSTPAPEVSFECFRACLVTENVQLIDTIIDHITASSNVTAGVMLQRTKYVFMPLIPLMSTLKDPDSTDSVPGLVKLSRIAIDLYMKDVPPRLPTAQEISLIVDAIVSSESSGTLCDLVLPKLKAIPANETLTKTLIQKLESCKAHLKFPEGSHISVTSITTDLVDDLITRFKYGPDRAAFIRLLEFCFDSNNAHVAAKLCARLAYPVNINPDPNYISNVLMPLLPEIQSVLTKRSIQASAEPFRALYKDVLESYLEKVLGKKPPGVTGFTGVSCRCDECKKVVAFLLNSPNASCTLDRIGAPKRKHVEQQLSIHSGSKVASWSTTRGSPQGLLIIKHDAVLLPLKWMKLRTYAISTFNAITKDDSVRRAIIGHGYQAFVAFLNGTLTSMPVEPSSRLTWGDSSQPATVARFSVVSAPLASGSNVAINRPSGSMTDVATVSSASGTREPDQISLVGQPPLKKRRPNISESIDVIDLCSD